MKILTLLVCGLLLILSEARDEIKITENQAKHLIRQLRGASKKYNLNCDTYLEYCENSQNKPKGITKELCPVIFKAYLCDDITTPDKMIEVLIKFAKENENMSDKPE